MECLGIPKWIEFDKKLYVYICVFYRILSNAYWYTIICFPECIISHSVTSSSIILQLRFKAEWFLLFQVIKNKMGNFQFSTTEEAMEIFESYIALILPPETTIKLHNWFQHICLYKSINRLIFNIVLIN